MIERVAQAIDPAAFRPWAFENGDLDLTDSAVVGMIESKRGRQEDAREKARSAIAAMRRIRGNAWNDRITAAINLALQDAGVTNLSIGGAWAAWDAIIEAALRCGDRPEAAEDRT